MPDLTANAQIILKRRLTALAEDAQADRTASNLSKALGLSSLVLGGLAAVSTGGLATIPLGIGLAAYLGGVMSQARKTGRTMLIPFSDAGLVEMLGGVAGAAVELPDLEDYAYMSTQQKAEYAMILTCGNRLATALAQLPGDQHRQFAYAIAKRRFFELYGSHVKNSPELLMAVDAAEVAEFILAGEDEFKRLRAKQASLPPVEAEQLPAPEQPQSTPPTPTVGPATRLGAISVPAVPAAPVEVDPDPSMRFALHREKLQLRPETHLKLLAPSRGGKTNTLLHLLTGCSRVTYLTLKDSDRVPQDWKGYRLRPFNIHADIAAVLSEVQPIIAAILDGRDRQPHWLVIDEALAITDLLESQAESPEDKRIAGQFSSLIKLLLATGAAQGAMLALMSQTQNGSDIKGISAASLQNLWTVICGSERCADGFSHMPAWYAKHVGALTGAQVTELQKLSTGGGFHQLAPVQGRPTLCSFPLFEGDLKGCLVPGRMSWPNPDAAAADSTALKESAASNEMAADIRTKLIEAGPLMASQIKQQVWALKSKPLEEVEQLLNELAGQGLVLVDGTKTPSRYLVATR